MEREHGLQPLFDANLASENRDETMLAGLEPTAKPIVRSLWHRLLSPYLKSDNNTILLSVNAT